MTKATVKVDKRSKAYRDSIKKLPQLKDLAKAATSFQDAMIKDMGKIVLQEQQAIPTLTSTTKDLQKQIDKLFSRILQLETKVG